MKIEDCVFCEIVAGTCAASIVHRDDHAVAFMDIAPVVDGHVLVIPTGHTPDLAGLTDAAGAHIFTLAKRVAAALRASGLPCEGINLFLADGAPAGQTVCHSHIHVIPRRRGDGLGFRHGTARGRASRLDLDEIAKRLSARV
jgi:histidine triad (HIT) family protein